MQGDGAASNYINCGVKRVEFTAFSKILTNSKHIFTKNFYFSKESAINSLKTNIELKTSIRSVVPASLQDF